jgi:hypothetical protein
MQAKTAVSSLIRNRILSAPFVPIRTNSFLLAFKVLAGPNSLVKASESFAQQGTECEYQVTKWSGHLHTQKRIPPQPRTRK